VRGSRRVYGYREDEGHAGRTRRAFSVGAKPAEIALNECFSQGTSLLRCFCDGLDEGLENGNWVSQFPRGFRVETPMPLCREIPGRTKEIAESATAGCVGLRLVVAGNRCYTRTQVVGRFGSGLAWGRIRVLLASPRQSHGNSSEFTHEPCRADYGGRVRSLWSQ